MSYYGGRGDYYRGVGDPGIFSFLGGIGKTILSKFVPGGGLAVTALEAAGKIAGHAVAKRPSFQPNVIGRALGYHAGTAIAAAAPSLSPMQPQVGRGSHAKQLAAMAGVPYRKHRHMNVANVKALRRGVRRLAGFYKLSQHVMKELAHVVHKHHAAPRAPKRLPRGRGDFYMGDG
jgi:hypothetical protein